MKKISHYFKVIFSSLLKVIITVMTGIGSSFGKKPMKIEEEDNKSISTKK
jgi:hypothetical protein